MKIFSIIFICLFISNQTFGSMIIDFNTENWESQIDSLQGQNIISITFQNYNGELDNIDSKLTIQNLTFEKGEIKRIPKFLINKPLNYLSFIDVEFNNSNIDFKLLKSLARISISGELTDKLPRGIETINGLTHLFIINTSIQICNIDFSKLQVLKVLNLRKNVNLLSVNGDIGKCSKLRELEIFECDNLKRLEISENTNLIRLRIGSWSTEFNIQIGLGNFLNLQTVIIDNYRSSNLSLEFLLGKPITELKVYCPTKEHLEVIREIITLETVGIWRQIKCSNQSFLYTELTSLTNLVSLTLNLGDLNSSEQFIEYVTSLKNLEYINLIDTKWDRTQSSNALSKVPKTLKLEINN